MLFVLIIAIPTAMAQTTGVDTKQEEIREDRTREILQCEQWHSQYQTDSFDNFMTLKDVKHAHMCIMLYNDPIWNYGEEDRIEKIVEYSLIPRTASTSSPQIESTSSETSSSGSIKVSGSEFLISYDITTGSVVSVVPDVDANSLMVEIDAAAGGSITLELPRTVVDAKFNGVDDEFFVVIDGEEVSFEESSTQTHRNLTVSFPPDTEEIEIIGTFVIPEFGTIAMMILVVSIISITAITAKSKLSLRL